MHSMKIEKCINVYSVKMERHLSALPWSVFLSKLFTNLKLNDSNRAKTAQVLTLCARSPTCYNDLPYLIKFPECSATFMSL